MHASASAPRTQRTTRVLSRHRLPTRFRLPIVCLWLLPGFMFTATIALSRGAAASPALLDPRWWGLLLVMAVPALYIWREGVDVVEWQTDKGSVERGLIRRIHTPRTYRFHDLSRWTCLPRLPTAPGGLLTIYDRQQAKALECHAAHLTNMPRLLQALHEHLPGS